MRSLLVGFMNMIGQHRVVGAWIHAYVSLKCKNLADFDEFALTVLEPRFHVILFYFLWKCDVHLYFYNRNVHYGVKENYSLLVDLLAIKHFLPNPNINVGIKHTCYAFL